MRERYIYLEKMDDREREIKGKDREDAGGERGKKIFKSLYE